MFQLILLIFEVIALIFLVCTFFLDKSPKEIFSKIFSFIKFNSAKCFLDDYDSEASKDKLNYKINTITCKTEWKLDGINKGVLLSIYSYNGPVILTSNKFNCRELPNVFWELYFEIGKKDWRNPNPTLTIWLRQTGPNGIGGLVNTQYKIYSLKDENERIYISKSSNKYENQDMLGYTLINNLNHLCHSDGSLYLHCEVKFDTFTSEDSFDINYSNFFKDEILTDFLIKVDKNVMKAHRFVLAKNSKVFYAMFLEKEKNMTEEIGYNGTTVIANERYSGNELTISNFTSQSVQTMLQFFYTGELEKNLTERQLEEIFVIAHEYRVARLIYKCEIVMSTFIDTKNILKYFKIINVYGAPILERGCKNYIRDNKEFFLKTKEWEEVEKIFPKLAFRILKSAMHELTN
uniref:BTB domain-containing protein n=1 Tax=Meloidogyne incognita TaxID=6306 RepID=A0A914LD01_MELIC